MVSPAAKKLTARAKTKVLRFARDDSSIQTRGFYSAAFFGGSISKSFITICKSFQASPFCRGSRKR